MVPYLPKNKFETIQKIKMDEPLGTCAYFGQVDEQTKRPNGIGVLVSQQQVIVEGGFKDGQIVPSYRKITLQKDCLQLEICFRTKDDVQYIVVLK